MVRGGITNGKEGGSGFETTGIATNLTNESPGGRPISAGNTAIRQQEKGIIDEAAW
jgi:hypothetical protein